MSLSVIQSPQPSPAFGCDWQPFANHLAAALSQMRDKQYLILEVAQRQRYVQFAVQGTSGLRAEVVSNAYLPESDQLGADVIESLKIAGWHAPTHDPDAPKARRDAAGSPNFFADFDAPVPFAEVADLAVRTLAGTLDVTHPDLLEYAAFDADGKPLSFPDLCRRRAERKPSPTESLASAADALLSTVRNFTGFHDLEFDADGDLGLRRGSSAVFVRTVGATPTVRIWSPLLRGVDQTQALLVQLNLLNAGEDLVRFYVRNGMVYADAQVCAAPFVGEHVENALRHFCTATDGVDAMLQREFGGGTAFEEFLPRTLLH